MQLVLSAYNFRMELLISDHCIQPSSTVSVASEAMAEPSLEMGFNQVVQLALGEGEAVQPFYFKSEGCSRQTNTLWCVCASLLQVHSQVIICYKVYFYTIYRLGFQARFLDCASLGGAQCMSEAVFLILGRSQCSHFRKIGFG